MRLRTSLKGRVEDAYIFGHNSDVDVMLVIKTEKLFLDRALDYPVLQRLFFAYNHRTFHFQETRCLETQERAYGYGRLKVS